ncbi:MAG TPA: hypothetical protein VFZ58_00535 [Candidatus Saccharimonadales bacterium]
MEQDIQKKLLAKQMTRREFLQFLTGSLLVLFGLGNLLALMGHVKKTAVGEQHASHGFGSRKFGA